MAAMVDGEVKPVKLEKVAGKLKSVPKDYSLVLQAKQMGISFGEPIAAE